MGDETSSSVHLDWFEGAAPPTLETERLELRTLGAEDAAGVFEIFSSPDVMRFWGQLPFEQLAEAHARIKEGARLFGRRTGMQWGLFRRSDGRLVGQCTLFKLDLEQRRAEVGFALTRDAWGHGLMTEALIRVIRFSFEDLKLRRLEADADPRNEASLRVLAKQGFRREGYLRERWCVAEEVQDSVFLGLLAREWLGNEGSSTVAP